MQSSQFERIRVMRVIARMNVGGPAVQISELMRTMDKNFFDHRLYTGFCSEDESDYLDSVALDVNATRIHGLGKHISLRQDLMALKTLIVEIRKFKPHVIHTHTAKAGFLGRLASLLSFQKSVRIHTFHGHLLNGYFGKIKRLIIVFLERSMANFTDQLLAVGEQVRQDLLDAKIGTPKKFEVMRPGLRIAELPEKSGSRISLGLNVNQLQCAFIGRVTQIKRPDRFLDVVEEIQKRSINLNFFMAGDGDLLEYCRKRISEKKLPVTVLGWQNNLEQLISAADIVILTSDNEGTPLSLIQAGMGGLPVVSTHVGSVPEIVIDQVTGLVTSLNVVDIANALEKLVKDEKFRKLLGMSAQKFTLENFSVDSLVSNHEKLYKRLVFNQAMS